jgi:signal transduction histidine kinase
MHADYEKVTQILVNLLSNAIKFTGSAGRVGLTCEALEQTIRIHVSDSGIGIPSEKLEAIFEPFVQVSSEPTSRGAGLGLGLAISRDLARAMNGDLTVESTLGAGSRFTLTLPRGRDAEARSR